jgi:hypothetical protein
VVHRTAAVAGGVLLAPFSASARGGRVGGDAAGGVPSGAEQSPATVASPAGGLAHEPASSGLDTLEAAPRESAGTAAQTGMASMGAADTVVDREPTALAADASTVSSDVHDGGAGRHDGIGRVDNQTGPQRTLPVGRVVTDRCRVVTDRCRVVTDRCRVVTDRCRVVTDRCRGIWCWLRRRYGIGVGICWPGRRPGRIGTWLSILSIGPSSPGLVLCRCLLSGWWQARTRWTGWRWRSS